MPARSYLVLALVAAGCLLAGFFIHAAVSTDGGPPRPAAGPGADKRLYVCSMNYSHHAYFSSTNPDEPCAYCGMQLVAATTEQAASAPADTLVLSPSAKALKNIATSAVERKFVPVEVRMVGKIAYDETRLAHITAWVGGRLDRLFVDYTGIQVRKGDHMVELYSPELLSAQEELIQARKAVESLRDSNVGIVRETTEATVTAAREKLRLWGLTAEQIRRIETTGKATDRVTIYAPVGGIVIGKDVKQGAYVQTGTRIYTIADLSRVWVLLEAYESDLSWLKYGQPVTFTAAALPGRSFAGTIAFIDPVLDARTRTVKVRVNAVNAEGLLKPNMFVKAVVSSKVAAAGKVMSAALAGKWISPMHPEVVKDGPGKCDVCGMDLVPAESLGYVSASDAKAEKPLVIPASAVLATGRRAVVYVKAPNTDSPTFKLREVTLGPRAGDYYVVTAGLREGEQVVTRGSFMIDSERQLRAQPGMMSIMGGKSPAPAAKHGGHQHE